jgi:hypothetical protein
VARHVAEKLTQGIWLGFVQLIVLSFIFVPGLVASTSDLLLRLPFSRRLEKILHCCKELSMHPCCGIFYQKLSCFVSVQRLSESLIGRFFF